MNEEQIRIMRLLKKFIKEEGKPPTLNNFCQYLEKRQVDITGEFVLAKRRGLLKNISINKSEDFVFALVHFDDKDNDLMITTYGHHIRCNFHHSEAMYFIDRKPKPLDLGEAYLRLMPRDPNHKVISDSDYWYEMRQVYKEEQDTNRLT